MNNLDLEKISNTIKEILENLELRFYDFQYNSVSKILRIFIDKEGGVTIDDCKKTSMKISEILDNLDLIVSPYTLEVSSPGIERELKRPEHYKWAVGKFAEVILKDQRIRGYIRNAEESGVIIAASGAESLIPYSSILRAKVIEEIEYGKRR